MLVADIVLHVGVVTIQPFGCFYTAATRLWPFDGSMQNVQTSNEA